MILLEVEAENAAAAKDEKNVKRTKNAGEEEHGDVKKRRRKKLRGGATDQEILEVFDAMIDINDFRYKDAKKNLLTIPITVGVLKRYGHLLYPRITPLRTFAMIQSVNMPLSFDDFARINNGFLPLPPNRQKNDGTDIVGYNTDWNLLFNAILNDPRSRSERGRRGGIRHHP